MHWQKHQSPPSYSARCMKSTPRRVKYSASCMKSTPGCVHALTEASKPALIQCQVHEFHSQTRNMSLLGAGCAFLSVLSAGEAYTRSPASGVTPRLQFRAREGGYAVGCCQGNNSNCRVFLSSVQQPRSSGYYCECICASTHPPDTDSV